MAICMDVKQVRELYAEAGERGWVLPCFCSENLTTTEAILAATAEHGRSIGVADLPVTVAITVRYSHRPQAVYYTHSRRWETGLRLFLADLNVLAGPGGPYENLRVLVHLDHVQYDDDRELLDWDLSDFSSIMYDASALPMEQNMELTGRFAERQRNRILIEGACDEIVDATGAAHNAFTTPDKAERYLRSTGVDLIVANLGTEHRAGTKNLEYQSAAAKAIRNAIGSKIVMHGASSVTNEQVRNLYADGVCKVNIWTTLERDSAPVLFETLVRSADMAAGQGTAQRLMTEGLLGPAAPTGASIALSHCTTTARQEIIYREMKQIVGSYLAMWYV